MGMGGADNGGRPQHAMTNVFILALDDFNREELRSVSAAQDCRFHSLLDYELVRPRSRSIDWPGLKRKADEQLSGFDGTINGIAAFWDFPSTALASVLRNERGLPGPSNEATARCEHKYWSRVEQRAVVPDLLPAFQAVDPYAEDAVERLTIDPPFWIKPIKAHSSYLGFKIKQREQLAEHLPEIREKIGHFGDPFDDFLRHVAVPEAIAPVGGHSCIAEEIISAGRQATLEGYVFDGVVKIYGVIDSIRQGKHRSSFQRYQYPSRLPQRVKHRMIAAATAVIGQFAYDNGPFNIEFFWNRKRDTISLLEVNARISKSHCPLFRMVDGAAHLQVMVDLALGRRPEMPVRQGNFRIAAKFMVRSFVDDGVIRRLPDGDEIDRLHERFPEARIRLLAHEGDRLSDLPYQESYSYELAEVFLGAEDQHALLQRYGEAMDALSFEIDEDGKRRDAACRSRAEAEPAP